MSVSWEALAEDIRRADAATRTDGITGLDRLRAVRRFIRYVEEGPQMGKQARADADGWASIYLGSTMSGGSGQVRGNAGIGRKGAGKRLSAGEAKKLMRQQVVKERKLAAEVSKRNAAAKRAARAQQKARRG